MSFIITFIFCNIFQNYPHTLCVYNVSLLQFSAVINMYNDNNNHTILFILFIVLQNNTTYVYGILNKSSHNAVFA